MPSETKKYQEYARECVRLAGLADTIELREKLLGLARVWMEAALNEEDAEAMRPSPSRALEAKTGRPFPSRTLVEKPEQREEAWLGAAPARADEIAVAERISRDGIGSMNNVV